MKRTRRTRVGLVAVFYFECIGKLSCGMGGFRQHLFIKYVYRSDV